MTQIRRSGTEDQYTEREQLLQDFTELEAIAERESNAQRKRNAAVEREREAQGILVRYESTGAHRESESTIPSEAGSMPASKKAKRSPAARLVALKEDTLLAELQVRQKDREVTREKIDAEMELRRLEFEQRKIEWEAEREDRKANKALQMRQLQFQRCATRRGSVGCVRCPLRPTPLVSRLVQRTAEGDRRHPAGRVRSASAFAGQWAACGGR
jgi:hypothetical protein